MTTEPRVIPETQARATDSKKHGGVIDKVSSALHSAVERTKDLTGIGTHSDTAPSLPSTAPPTTAATTATTTEGGGRTGNRGVVFASSGNVEIREVSWPKMQIPWSEQPLKTGCIVKVLTAGICGSDLHPYRGRAMMESGTVMGHEFTGEVIEVGDGVEWTKVGDWGFIPFNVACGCCQSCKERKPEVCERTNDKRDEVGQCGLYGYCMGGGWQGGQAQFAFVPFCDYNFIKFECKIKAKQYLVDLTLLTDVLPTAYHGVECAGVDFGSTVFITGAGPIGITAAKLSLMKGAAKVIVVDPHADKLELARRLGCYCIDLTELKDESLLGEKINELIGDKFVDCGIEAVGYEAKKPGSTSKNVCQSALEMCIEAVKPGGNIGVLGAYFIGDPKAPHTHETKGMYTLSFGKAWLKAQTLHTGQASCIKYVHKLAKMIMCDKLPISKVLDARVISLDEAPAAYKAFRDGAPHKFIIDPHNTLGLISAATETTSGTSTTSTSTTDTIPGYRVA